MWDNTALKSVRSMRNTKLTARCSLLIWQGAQHQKQVTCPALLNPCIKIMLLSPDIFLSGITVKERHECSEFELSAQQIKKMMTLRCMYLTLQIVQWNKDQLNSLIETTQSGSPPMGAITSNPWLRGLLVSEVYKFFLWRERERDCSLKKIITHVLIK